jgi:RNA polymerase sigma-70 factor (family 1)
LAIERIHNETELVNQMQNGNAKAFTEIYLHYSPPIYLNILGIVRDPVIAEEIVQILFTRIWQKKDSISIKDNFSGYIFRISQNLIHDHFRKLKSDRKLLENFLALAEANLNTEEEGIYSQQSRQALNNAIQQLPPQQKKVYELVRLEGFTYKKAAELMGISTHTVKEYLVITNKSIRSFVLRNLDSSSLPFLLVSFLASLF